MNVTEAVENYLEAILVLSQSQDEIRATDICSYMSYSRPTVSIAVKGMKQNGLIHVDEHNRISLTEEGLSIAENIYDRHTTIAKVLMLLGVERAIALEDACKMEHDISNESFSSFKRFLNEHSSKS